MNCRNCENTLMDNEKFCTNCGSPAKKKENDFLEKTTPKYNIKFGRVILNFLQFNWFKVGILVSLFVFILLLALNGGIKVKVKHSGFIDLDMSGDVNTGIDGSTLYLVE